jgi:hypothetical protein
VDDVDCRGIHGVPDHFWNRYREAK